MPFRRRALPVYFISRETSREAKWTGKMDKSEAVMNYQTLERTIGHQFADIGLLDLAMTHPSYALQHKCQDNQRLEFLGDAVLEICVSRVIYHQYPKLREGQLTRKRAALVCEANLAKAATRLGLGSYLKLDRGEEVVGGRENPSILADTMEAVIAAVYLDAGMEEAAKLVDLAMGDYKTSDLHERTATRRALCRNTCRRWARKRRPTKSSGRTARRMPVCSPRGFCVRMAANWARARARANSAPKRPPRRWRCKRCIRLNETRVRGYGKGSHRCG